MIAEAFMVCALAMPATHFTWPKIVSWQMVRSEEDKLKAWIRKNNPEAEVFITPKGQEGKLKEYGWERVPINWKGKQIWIQRKPKTIHQQRIETSA